MIVNPKALPNAKKSPLWPCSRGRTVRLVRDSFDVSGCLEQVRAVGRGRRAARGRSRRPHQSRTRAPTQFERRRARSYTGTLAAPQVADLSQMLPTADFVAGAARSRHERRVSGDPCKPSRIMMLGRCPEEGGRIDGAAGAHGRSLQLAVKT